MRRNCDFICNKKICVRCNAFDFCQHFCLKSKVNWASPDDTVWVHFATWTFLFHFFAISVWIISRALLQASENCSTILFVVIISSTCLNKLIMWTQAPAHCRDNKSNYLCVLICHLEKKKVQYEHILRDNQLIKAWENVPRLNISVLDRNSCRNRTKILIYFCNKKKMKFFYVV